MTQEEKQEIIEMITYHLKIAVDKDTHVYTNQEQVVVTLLWDGIEINSDRVTLGV